MPWSIFVGGAGKLIGPAGGGALFVSPSADQTVIDAMREGLHATSETGFGYMSTLDTYFAGTTRDANITLNSLKTLEELGIDGVRVLTLHALRAAGTLAALLKDQGLAVETPGMNMVRLLERSPDNVDEALLKLRNFYDIEVGRSTALGNGLRLILPLGRMYTWNDLREVASAVVGAFGRVSLLPSSPIDPRLNPYGDAAWALSGYGLPQPGSLMFTAEQYDELSRYYLGN